MSMRHRRHGLSTKVGDLLADAGEGVMIAVGRTVPTDGAKGYGKGCLWIQPGATGSTDVWYINVGSRSSCNFDVLPSQTEFAVLDGLTATQSELNTSVAGLLATAAEINAEADVSTRIVNTTATQLAVTAALHSGRIVKVSSTSPIAITLPASTGGGDIYTFIMNVVATATAHTIKVANTTDILAGVSIIAQTDTAQVNGFLTTATDDTISLNGTTKGGIVGDKIQIIDITSGKFQVTVLGGASGTVVTPFSATV